MEKAKACYSLSSIKECQKRVRQFSWSTRYKGEHYSRCIRVRDLYVYCQYELKSFLFDPDYSPARDYIDSSHLRIITCINSIDAGCFDKATNPLFYAITVGSAIEIPFDNASRPCALELHIVICSSIIFKRNEDS